MDFEFQQLESSVKFKEPIIGLGAQTKSSLALGLDKSIYVSKARGDLSDPVEFGVFKKVLAYFIRRGKVKNFSHDLHPQYTSTQFIKEYAQENNHCRTFGVQHHQAHIASCMLEHNLKGKVIAVVFDGTGLGLDGAFWGGDFFIGDYQRFTRLAHLKYAALIGGQEAIVEPWRLACSWLYEIYRDRFLNLKIDFIKSIDKKKWPFLKKMLVKKINTPLTSSAGRLFDAVSALLGLVRKKISYEAEGPIKLEALALKFNSAANAKMYYNYKIHKRSSLLVIDPGLILKGIVSDLKKNVPGENIAYKFHHTLALLIVDVVYKLWQEARLKAVVLSGGVFNNRLLRALATNLLQEKGFKVFINCRFGPGDSSLALGQIMLANATAKFAKS